MQEQHSKEQSTDLKESVKGNRERSEVEKECRTDVTELQNKNTNNVKHTVKKKMG